MNRLRRNILSFVSLVLSTTLLLSCCGCKTDIQKDNTDGYQFKYSSGAHTYGYIDIGVCRKLVGDVYTLVIFLDDDVSSWDEESRAAFYEKKYFPSINYLTKEAEEREIELNLQSGQYTTKSDLKTPLRYNGVVNISADVSQQNIDILEQAAKALGFTDSEYMQAFLKNNLKVEQIAYILALNKSGRAYAVYDSTYNGSDFVEFVVAFSTNENGDDNIGSSILHELLHLFGASDLYDTNGKYPERYALCKKLFPNDIMRRLAVSPESLEIGALTEYLIGWSDSFPTVCDCPEWWSSEEVSD